MPTDGLVARLHAAIDETARLAEAASRTGVAFVWARRGGRVTMRAHLARSADPAAVLRLCQAHRDILELHAGEHECAVVTEGVYPPDWNSTWPYGKPGELWRRVTSEYFEAGQPCPTVAGLARGYGLQKGQS